MRKIILWSLFFASSVLWIVNYFCTDLQAIPDYYGRNIRGSLFTGFLTMGSFLLSLKAFIVVKLKENVFDSESYKKNFTNLKKLTPELTLYGPLRRLSNLIFVTITFAIVASVSQLSIGLVDHWIAVFIAVFLAASAIAMLASTLFVVRQILEEWLEYLETDYAEKSKENDL